MGAEEAQPVDQALAIVASGVGYRIAGEEIALARQPAPQGHSGNVGRHQGGRGDDRRGEHRQDEEVEAYPMDVGAKPSEGKRKRPRNNELEKKLKEKDEYLLRLNNNATSIEFKESADFQLYDISGSLLISVEEAFAVDIDGIANGAYLYYLVINNIEYRGKLLINRL